MARWVAGVSVVVTLVAAGCSSGASSEGGGEGSAEGTGAAGAAAFDPDQRRCDQGATQDEVVAEPVDGIGSDLTVTSFDGTEIRIHWFPAPGAGGSGPAPSVLKGPGWSLPGDTIVDEEQAAILGSLSIPALHDAGYNVLTWDPRGFGESTGTVEVNSADAEGRDVQVLLDWLATRPEARTDAEGDPRVGMVGASYGGGIQLVAAAIDCRIDAIVPDVAWHSLESSLYRDETVKTWSELLATAAAGRPLDPHVTSAAEASASSGRLSEEDREWFADRGPSDLVGQIEVPTLLVHGTVDTLFPLGEAIRNFEVLGDGDAPVGMLWYCGGHGTCLTDPGDEERPTRVALRWLDRYVKGDDEVEPGPAFSLVDQHGTTWTADAYPSADVELTATGEGSLTLDAGGGAGPIDAPGDPADVLAGLVVDFTPAEADHALEVPVEVGDVEGMALGSPRLGLTYSGTVPDGEAPTRLFAQIVDDETGRVLGNQITPIAVTLDGEVHTTEVDLEVIAHLVEPGQRLTLQIVATTVAYATPRLGGSVDIDDVELSIPVTQALTPAG